MCSTANPCASECARVAAVDEPARRSLSGTVTEGRGMLTKNCAACLWARVFMSTIRLCQSNLSERTARTKNDRVVAILNLTGFSRGCFDIDISHG